jgi:hypothetical protein
MTFTTFEIDDDLLPLDNHGIVARLRPFLVPATPGSFMGYPFYKYGRSFYYIMPLRCHYPWIDILVRDYTEALTMENGTFLILRMHYESGLITPPKLQGRLWLKNNYYWFLHRYLPRLHWVPDLDDHSFAP